MNLDLEALAWTEWKLPEFSEEELLTSLFWNENYDALKDKFRELRELDKWKPLAMFDFDDTLYSRLATLELEGLSNNRWDDWNAWLLAHYWWIINPEDNEKVTEETKKAVDKMSKEEIDNAIQAFADEFYSAEPDWKKKKWLVLNFIELLWDRESRDILILTAWVKEIQETKLKNTGVDDIETRVVKKSSQKIREVILYVLEKGKIPESIIMHEDRPEYFHKYAQALSNLLWTEIQTNTVNIDPETNIADIVWKVLAKPQKNEK